MAPQAPCSSQESDRNLPITKPEAGEAQVTLPFCGYGYCYLPKCMLMETSRQVELQFFGECSRIPNTKGDRCLEIVQKTGGPRIWYSARSSPPVFSALTVDGRKYAQSSPIEDQKRGRARTVSM
jgi:hypothetical protein